MLPNDDFKAGVVSDSPMEFSLPREYVGQMEFNGPLRGWRTPVSFSTLVVDSVDISAYGVIGSPDTEIFTGSQLGHHIEFRQARVYDFGLLYGITISDEFLYRRIHLHGLLGEHASSRRIKNEFFVAVQGDAFELVIHPLNDLAEPHGVGAIEDIVWQLRDEDENVVMTRRYSDEEEENIILSASLAAILILLTSENTENLSGTYLQEAMVLLSDGTVHTFFKGSCNFVPMKGSFDA
jgi:hypothetical protein